MRKEVKRNKLIRITFLFAADLVKVWKHVEFTFLKQDKVTLLNEGG